MLQVIDIKIINVQQQLQWGIVCWVTFFSGFFKLQIGYLNEHAVPTSSRK
jgi:hypothetical protein